MDFGARLGCHQIPERCFFFKSFQFPVCARCTGVIIGEILFLILILFGIKFSFIVSCFMLIPMGVDWGLQYINLMPSTNLRRFITGLFGGAALTNIYYIAFFMLYHGIYNII